MINMMNMKKIIALLFIVITLSEVSAQQDPQYSQYMYNTISVNPGYAGTRNALTVSGLHRSQWVGIDGAPSTQTFFLHAPVFNEKIGLGLSAVNDRIGPINQSFIYGDFAYHLKINEHWKLGMGIKGSVNMLQPKIATLETTTANDPSFVNSTVRTTVSPNVGAGFYLYGDRMYIGISSPKLLQNKMKMSNDVQNNILIKRHFFVIAGTVLKINDDMKFKPTVLTKITSGAPISADLSAEFLLYDKWAFGVSHRWKESVSGLFNVNVMPQLKIGAAYDFTLTDLRKYNSGSFELMVIYDFIVKKDKLKSPRYF
jgi:type IX secretion system PorP/SprF family membrane protein